jgi:plasmid maintenance system antidote protein VapI
VPDLIVPDLTVGVALLRFIATEGLCQKDFADTIGVSEKHMSGLIRGRVGISPTTGVVLEASTGVRAGVWAAMYVEAAASTLRARPEVRDRIWEIQHRMRVLRESPPPDPTGRPGQPRTSRGVPR